MAREDLVYKVGVDASDAVGGLRKLEGAVRSTMSEVEGELDDGATAGDKFAASVERLSATMREDFNSAAIAAEELQAALKRAGSGLEVGDAITELSRMGVSFDEITQDADKFATALKQLDDVRLEGVKELDSVAPGLATKLQDVNNAGDQTKSVMANLAGNAAQDLGALGGVAGTAGVALGQLAEYATEGNISMKALAGLAGPMLGVAVATELIGKGMESMKAAEAFETKRVESWVEALMEGKDAATALSDELAEVGKAEVVTEGLFGNTWFSRIDDAKWAIANAGLTFDTFAEIVAGGAEEIARWEQEALAQGKRAEDVRWTVQAMNSELDASARAESEAAGMTALLTRSLGSAQSGMEDFVEAADPVAAMPEDFAAVAEGLARVAEGGKLTQKETDALNRIMAETGMTAEEVYGEARGLLDEQAQATEEAAQRTLELAEAAGEVEEAFAGAEQTVAALSGVLEDLNRSTPLAFADRAADTVQSFDDLKTALEEVKDLGSKPLAPTTVEDLRGLSEESSKVIDAMGGMRDAIQTELVAALEDAGGNLDTYRDKAGFFRDEVTAQFTSAFQAMGLGPAEVDAKVTELLGNLGLLPSQVETQIRLTQDAEALAKIELFGDALANLPASVQAQVAATVSTDPQGAWNTINEAIQAAGAAEVDVVPGVDEATPAIEEIEDGTYEAEVGVGADTRDAERKREGFVDTTQRTKPIVPVDSDVKAAIATMMYLRILAAILAPEVVVTANTTPARNSLTALGRTDVNVPVDAYLADYPTAGEIQRAIGRPRIPVDIVVGQSIRITGVRE